LLRRRGFDFVTMTGNTKRSWHNPAIICALIVLIVIGFTVMKVASNPPGPKDEIRAERSTGPEQSGLQDSIAPSLPGSDTLDKLRCLRSPALEREILDIARASVAEVIQNKGTESKPEDSAESVSSPLQEMQAGVFVTLIIDGKVRGCMGRIHPAEPNLQAEIARAAKMAATMDMRHPPIGAEDLTKLDFCVSVVGRVRERVRYRSKPASRRDIGKDRRTLRSDSARRGQNCSISKKVGDAGSRHRPGSSI